MTADEWSVLIIPIAAVVILFILCGAVDFIYTRRVREEVTTITQFNSDKQSAPVIGYKRANIGRVGYRADLKGTKWLTNLYFTGIVGYEYQINDHAKNGKGFHMYSSLSDAIKHPQDAEVILEVLGYGEVIESESGYLTSDQRVLQVLIGECDQCYKQASYLSMSSDFDLVKLCSEHGGSCRPRCVSLSELAEQDLPGNVIFAPLTDTPEMSAFTPTVIEHAEV